MESEFNVTHLNRTLSSFGRRPVHYTNKCSFLSRTQMRIHVHVRSETEDCLKAVLSAVPFDIWKSLYKQLYILMNPYGG